MDDHDFQPALGFSDRSHSGEFLYGWAISLIASLLAVGNILLGLVVGLFPERLGGVNFLYIRDLMPAWAWGAGFVLSGIVALWGQYTHRMWPTRLSHSASAFACSYWVVAFALAAATSPLASLTGIVAYAMIAGVHAVVAVVSPHK